MPRKKKTRFGFIIPLALAVIMGGALLATREYSQQAQTTGNGSIVGASDSGWCCFTNKITCSQYADYEVTCNAVATKAAGFIVRHVSPNEGVCNWLCSNTGTKSSKSGSAKSGSAQSASAKSGSAKSASAKSGSAQSASAKSGSAKSGSAKSASAKSGSAQSASAKSGSAKSGSAQSASAKSGSAKSGSAQSASAKSGSAKSGSAKSGSAQSASAKSGSAKSASAKSGSAKSNSSSPDGPVTKKGYPVCCNQINGDSFMAAVGGVPEIPENYVPPYFPYQGTIDDINACIKTGDYVLMQLDALVPQDEDGLKAFVASCVEIQKEYEDDAGGTLSPGEYPVWCANPVLGCIATKAADCPYPFTKQNPEARKKYCEPLVVDNICQCSSGQAFNPVSGQCETAGSSCSLTQPGKVCGCNGFTYRNACDAAGEGIKLWQPDACSQNAGPGPKNK